MDELSEDDKLIVARARKFALLSNLSMWRKCSPPLSMCPSRRPSAASEILDGKHDDPPEAAFYMVGTIEDAIKELKLYGGLIMVTNLLTVVTPERQVFQESVNMVTVRTVEGDGVLRASLVAPLTIEQ